jgi:hypothetical protein
MTLRLLLSFVVATAVGWLIVALLWPAGARGTRPQRLTAIFLGFGIGHGVTSCIAFLYVVVRGRADSAYALVELLLLAVLLGLFGLAGRHRRDITALSSPPDASSGRGGMLLAAAFYTTAAMALGAVAIRSSQIPHGEYDAWAIWNARARAIFRAGETWRDNIWNAAVGHAQLDYPLMLPMSVLRGWMYAGAETVLVPILLAWLFTLATIGLLTAGVAALCGRRHAYAAGIVLLGYMHFTLHAASQFAEAPLCHLYLSALVAIAFYNAGQPGKERGALLLAGLSAGLAAWTKNEGLLFLLALGFAHCTVVIYSAGAREYLRQARALAAGLLPIAAVLVYFKLQFAPQNIIMAEMRGANVANQVFDLQRHLVIGSLLARRLLLYEGLGINMIYVLAFLLACFGLTRTHLVSVAQITLVIATMFSGFMGIYLLRVPSDSDFIVGSLDRLLLQLWPLLVFGFFLLAAPLARAGATRVK